MMKKFFVFLLLFVTLFLGGIVFLATLDKPDAITYLERRQELKEELGDEIYEMVFLDEDLDYYYGFDVEEYRQWVESNPLSLPPYYFENSKEGFERRIEEMRVDPNYILKMYILEFEISRIFFEEMGDGWKTIFDLDGSIRKANKHWLGIKSDDDYIDWKEMQDEKLSEYFSENFLDFLSPSERAYYEEKMVGDFSFYDSRAAYVDDFYVYNSDGDYLVVFSRTVYFEGGYGEFYVIVRKTADGFQALKTYYDEWVYSD